MEILDRSDWNDIEISARGSISLQRKKQRRTVLKLISQFNAKKLTPFKNSYVDSAKMNQTHFNGEVSLEKLFITFKRPL